MKGKNRTNLYKKLRPRVETLFDVALANVKLSINVKRSPKDKCRFPYIEEHIEESKTLLEEIIHKEERGLNKKGLEVIYLFQGVAYGKLGHLFYQCSLLKETQARQGKSERVYEESKNYLEKAKDYFKVAQEAFKDALEINDQYARAYLAQGALLYGQRVQSIGKWGNERIVEEKIDEAIVQYRKALDAEIKHPKAYVDIKTNYNLGLAITVKENLQPSDCSKPNKEAIETLQNVISAYDRKTIIDIIQRLTAKAYYQVGLLYKNCGNRKPKEAISDKLQLYDDAVKEFKNSILLFSTKPEKDWQQDIWIICLSLANTYLLSAELGKTDMYQQAIDIYNKIIQHYEEYQKISTNIAAESYLNWGLALTKTNNTTKAVEKYQQISGLKLPISYQEKLILKSLQNKAHVQLEKLQELIAGGKIYENKQFNFPKTNIPSFTNIGINFCSPRTGKF